MARDPGRRPGGDGSLGHKLIKLLVPDPSQIAVVGGGESTLGCGAQQNRHVKIEYFPKANARLATTGEVATIEFQ